MTDGDADAAFHDGVPWWQLQKWPSTKKPFGGEPKLAAYLYFNLDVGDSFTMRDLRSALGDEAPNDDEHLNRRLRELKNHDWDFSSYKDQVGQEMNTYVLRKKGKRLWLGERNRRKPISAAVRREVLERDLNRCVICGIGVGEPYDGEPGTKARLTVGHRTAEARHGDASPDNLQTECSRCNEPVGDMPPNPETRAEVMAVVSKLGTRNMAVLLSWIESGYRHRNKVDIAYDRIRRLSVKEKAEVIGYLRAATHQV